MTAWLYARGEDGSSRFVTARPLRDVDVAALVRQIGTRVIRLLRRRGKWSDREADVEFDADESWPLQCQRLRELPDGRVVYELTS